MFCKLAWILSVLLLLWPTQESTDLGKQSRRGITPEAQVYAASKAAVVTVFCGDAKGSGFLVDQSGLIVTSAHVLRSGDPVKIKLSSGTLHRAVVLANDEKADVAVLWANSSLFQTVKPIPLPSPSDAAPFEGERILAIGSPLHQELIMTVGVVSKVTADAIISDVNINHGNSGGPVLNLDGKAVGIATFLDPGGNGPGVSGIIRIEVAQPALSRAKAGLEPVNMPEARPLPQPRLESLTEEEVLAKATELKRPESPFIKAPRNFRTYIETPFTSRRMALEEVKLFERDWKRTIGRRYKSGNPPKFSPRTSAFWEKYVGEITDPVILLKIIPWPQETSASQWRAFFGALVGASTPKTFEFRDDVAKVEVCVNGVPIEPYALIKVLHSEFVESYGFTIRDRAYGAVLQLDPVSFHPDNKITLKVWKNDRKDPDVFAVPESIQKEIWAPFDDWYRRLPESQRVLNSGF